MRPHPFEILHVEHVQMVTTPGLISDVWKEKLEGFHRIANMEESAFKGSFLKEPLLLQAMFLHQPGKLFDHQQTMVRKYLPADIVEKCIVEPAVGGPLMVNSTSTHNTVHHLYHIARYAKKKGWERFASTKSFVEWGGGYGNFCRLVKTMVPDATYVIIDLPAMSMIQYRYLTETLGSDAINVVSFHNREIVNGKVNLLPSTRWPENNTFKPIETEMMISTWALSECPVEVQESVFQTKLFNSTKGLFAFHQCGDHIPFMKESTNLKDVLVRDYNMQLDDMVVIPGVNYYAFV